MKQVMQNVKNSTSDGAFNIYEITKGVLFGYIVTLIMFVLFAMVLTFTSFPEKLIPTVVMICVVISVLIVGSNVAGAARSKGWLNGGLAGLVYLLILYLISGIAYSNFTLTPYTISLAIAAILSGAFGGIIGINLKKGGRRIR